MSDLIKIALVLIMIILLLRKKWHIGVVLCIGALSIAILYLMPPARILKASIDSLTSSVSLKLLFALSFIRTFELLLREKGLLSRITNATGSLLKRRRLVIISMPLLIGMLPSLGGAYFSAPMVEEASKGLGLSREDKAYINYWFRHPWELILPLYPGIVLASAVTEIPLRGFIIANLLVAIGMMIAGYFLGLRNIKGMVKAEDPEGALRDALLSLLPVISIIGAVIIFSVELHLALAVVILILILIYRESFKEIFRIFKYGFTKDVLLLIAGVMLLKGMMEASGAVEGLNRYFINTGLSQFIIAMVLPFIAGLLTGLVVGFVGSTFPLLIALAGKDLSLLSLAFVSGYAGVLLSPVHLCLVLTREYFKADMAGIYKRLVPGVILMIFIAMGVYYAFKS